MDGQLTTADIKAAMDDYGATGPKWRIKLQGVEHDPVSDYATIIVDVIKPRCRKPCTMWELTIWLPGKILRWDMSRHYTY